MARRRGKGPKKVNIAVRFDRYFGKGDLEDWQRLCSDIFEDWELATLDVSSKTKCRNLLRKVFVNIHDLLDAVESNPKQKPQRFSSLNSLVGYTVGSGRTFPLRQVKDELGPVRALLRRMII